MPSRDAMSQDTHLASQGDEVEDGLEKRSIESYPPLGTWTGSRSSTER